MNKKILLSVVVLLQCFVTFSQRDFSTRSINGNSSINIKGDMIFVGNNIVNRNTQSQPASTPLFVLSGGTYVEYMGNETANDPYTSDLYTYSPITDTYSPVSNQDVYMDYIDIDTDPTTFSSSKSTLDIQNDCYKIAYAGLYWAGVYPYANWNNILIGPDPAINEIKFKLPGETSYGTIIADETSATSGLQRSYTCYKDITDQLLNFIDAGGNPEGDYFAADIKATVGAGIDNIGSAAGWVMVVVYEDDNETTKNISILDGFQAIDNSNTNYVIPFNGFTTPLSGNVNAKVLTAALGGDNNQFGDTFEMLHSSGSYQEVTNSFYPVANNFFNGSITNTMGDLTTNDPANTNALGFDIDLVAIPNISNSVIANGQTSINFRYANTGSLNNLYFPFLTALAVDIEKPEVQVVKTTVDNSDADLAGETLDLGTEFWYNLHYENVGTAIANNVVITDVLPANVDLLTDTAGPEGLAIEVPTGVNVSFDASANTLTFTFDDPLDIGAFGDIRINVQVLQTCSELRDYCTNVVENQATVSYQNTSGTIVVENEESSNGLLGSSCTIGNRESSLVFIDDACVEAREQVLCGSSLDITAGNGYDSYVWTRAGTAGTVGGARILNVTTPGVYTVVKTRSIDQIDDCIHVSEEIVTVVSDDDELITNPITPFADKVVECASNGIEISEFYLCGSISSLDLSSGQTVASGTTVEWQMLSDACEPDGPTCPNLTNTCWVPISGNPNDFEQNFTEEGEYRLQIQDCSTREYYFNIFQGTFGGEEIVTKADILCTTPGAIYINNVPANSGYEYAVVENGISAADATFTQTTVSGNTYPVPVDGAGDYVVYIQTSGTGCLYTYDITVDFIGLEEANIDIVSGTNITCSDDPTSIDVEIIDTNNVGPFEYRLFRLNELTGTNDQVGTTTEKSDKGHSFPIPGSGEYTVNIIGQGGCTANKVVTIGSNEPLGISAIKRKNIDCTNGIITLTGLGGTLAGYRFAISSYIPGVDATKAAITTNTPITVDATTGDYSIAAGEQGSYEFIVFDSANCDASTMQSIDVELTELVQVGDIDIVKNEIDCEDDDNGSLVITVNNTPPGTVLEYSINGGTDFSTTSSYPDLEPGIQYNVSVRSTNIVDGSQCIIEPADFPGNPYTFTNPTPPSTSASITQQYISDCSGSPVYGVIEFDTSMNTGGTGVFQYGIDGVYNTNPVRGGYPGGGPYAISVRDANGCETNLEPLTFDDTTSSDNFNSEVVYNCSGGATITVTPTNASYTYTYILQGETVEQTQADPTSNVFENLPVGSHRILITDATCTNVANVSVASDQGLRGEISETGDATCSGSNNGYIAIQGFNTTSGGTFQISSDGTQWTTIEEDDTNPRLTGLPGSVEGITYDVFVRLVEIDDVNGDGELEPDEINEICSSFVGAQTIYEPEPLGVLSDQITEATCIDGTAIITVEGFGGSPFYDYRINELDDDGNIISTSDYQTETTFEVTGGTDYSVEVRDSRGCTECGCETDQFANSNFEDLSLFSADDLAKLNGDPSFVITSQDNLPGWETNTFGGRIEIWRSGKSAHGVTFNAADASIYDGTDFNDLFDGDGGGNYFAELNADKSAQLDKALYQNFCTTPGDVLEWSFLHRGRAGVDEMKVEIGGAIIGASAQPYTSITTPANSTSNTGSNIIATDNDAWQLVTGTYTVPPGQSSTFIIFRAESTSGNNDSVGNFIDNVTMEVISSDCEPEIIPIPEPEEITQRSSVLQCTGDNNAGTITVEAQTGNGDYSFGIDRGSGILYEKPENETDTSYSFTNLNPGDYTVYVLDGKGCVTKGETHTINVDLGLNAFPTEISCENLGSIEHTGTGGDGDYRYFVVEATADAADINGPDDSDFYPATSTSSLAQGFYNVYVRDHGGVEPYCQTKLENIQITIVATPTIMDITTTQPKCSGDTGRVTVTISGGFPPFNVNITGGALSAPINNTVNNNPFNIDMLEGSPTDYTITITDDNGCEIPPQTVNILEISGIESSGALTEDIDCSNQGGVITFEPATGGDENTASPPLYEYAIKDGTGVNAAIVSPYNTDLVKTDLGIGTYYLYVRDGNNHACEYQVVTDPIVITTRTIPTFTPTIAYDCEGNATVTIRPPSGVLSSDYEFTDGTDASTSPFPNVFTGVMPGPHTFTVSDTRNGLECTGLVNFNVLENEDFGNDITVTSTRPECNNGDGTITLTTPSFDATDNYEYTIYLDGDTPNWTPLTTNSLDVNRASGDYIVEVRIPNADDITGYCSVMRNIGILNKDAVVITNVTTTPIFCVPETNATIIPTAGGGNGGDYSYELNNILTPGTIITSTLINAGTDIGFDNVPAGTYQLTAIDNTNVCRSEGFEVTILDPVDPVFTLEATVCYDEDPFNGEITVDIEAPDATAADGGYIPIYTIALRDDVGDDVTLPVQLPVGTTEYTFNGETYLTPGETYTVVVTDGRGCSTSDDIDLRDELKVTVVPPTTANCSYQTFTIEATGGSLNYQYAVVPVGSTATPVFTTTNTYTPSATESAAGTDFTVYVRDLAFAGTLGEDYCEAMTTVELDPFAPVEIANIPDVAPTCFGDTANIVVNLTPMTGNGQYSVNIIGGTINRTFDSSEEAIDILDLPTSPAGITYTVTVTDGNGCSDTETTTLYSMPDLELIVIEGVNPVDCTDLVNYGYEYDISTAFVNSIPTGYTLQVLHADDSDPMTTGDNVWVDATGGPLDSGNDSFTGFPPNTEVITGIRIINDIGGGVECIEQKRFTVPFELQGLIINPLVSADCDLGFTVAVEADGGSSITSGDYEFAINDPDPITGTWYQSTGPSINGLPGSFEFTTAAHGIVLGGEYTFYVRDSDGCINQNDEDLYVDAQSPIEITFTDIDNTCDILGGTDGSITFTVDTEENFNSSGQPELGSDFTWTLYTRDNTGDGVVYAANPSYVNQSSTTLPGYPYPYPGPGSIDIEVDNLPAGDYYIIIDSGTGGFGCSWASGDATIQDPINEISGNLQGITDVTCSTPGQVSIQNVQGGFPGYTYTATLTHDGTVYTDVDANYEFNSVMQTSFIVGNTVQIPYNIITDATQDVTVEVTVTDSSNCEHPLTPVVVSVVDVPTINDVVTDNCEKEITITASGGSGSYTYFLYDSTGTTIEREQDNDNVFENVATGAYQVRIEDTNGCEVTYPTNVVIYEDVAYTLTPDLMATLDCNGTNATYSLEITAGSATGYTYQVIKTSNSEIVVPTTALAHGIPITFDILNEANDLNQGAGEYQITITDDINNGLVTGCPIVNTFDVDPPTVPEFTAKGEELDCVGDMNGVITISPLVGIVANYEVFEDGSTTALTGITYNPATNGLSPLPMGDYDIIGTAANSCRSLIVKASITNPATLTPPMISSSEYECTVGNTNGVATVSFDYDDIIGGTGDYIVSLYSTVGTTTDLTDDVLLNISPSIDTSTNEYTYSFSDLSGGEYYISILDENNCSETTNTVTIDPFIALEEVTVVTNRDKTCDLGELIDISFTSSAPITNDITIRIDKIENGNVVPIETLTQNSDVVPGPISTGDVVTNTIPLDAGFYNITVINGATNCEIIAIDGHTVEEDPIYNVNLSLDAAFVCSDSDEDAAVTITITDVEGEDYTGNFSYTVFDENDMTVTTITSTPTGHTGPTATITGLGVGEGYYVTVAIEDYFDCPYTSDPFDIVAPDEDVIQIMTKIGATSCVTDAGISNNGSITVTETTGGFPGGDYEYALVAGNTTTPPADTPYTLLATDTEYPDGETIAIYSSTDSFESLFAGDYVVWVRDSNECETATDFVVVPEPTPITFTVSKQDNACDVDNAVILVTPTGGTGTYTVVATHTDPSIQSTKKIQGDLALGEAIELIVTNSGDYTITVTDSNGCSGTTTGNTDITINPDLVFGASPTKLLDCHPTDPEATFDLEVTEGSGNYSYQILDENKDPVIPVISGTIGTAITPLSIPAEGTYFVEVMDVGSNCSSLQEIRVSPIVEPDFEPTLSGNNFCYEEDSARIDITVTANSASLPVTEGGIDRFLQFELTGTLFPSNVTFGPQLTDELSFTDLAPGDYIITAIGTNYCTSTSDVIEIRELDPVTFEHTLTQFGCRPEYTTNTRSSATIELFDFAGGSGVYENIKFTYTPTIGDKEMTEGRSFMFSTENTSGGSVFIEVFDNGNGCPGTLTLDIDPFIELVEPEFDIDKLIDCDTGENITVTHEASATMNLEYIVASTTGSYEEIRADGIFIGLATDVYRVGVRNLDTGCEVYIATPYEVDPEPTFNLFIREESKVCPQDASGSIIFSFAEDTPYTGLYDYQVYRSNGDPVGNLVTGVQGEQIAGDLDAGTYYVALTLTDSPFCDVESIEVTLDATPDDLSVDTMITEINCNGDNTGEVILLGDGGWTVYEYELVKTGVTTPIQEFDSNAIIKGLDEGEYTVTVMDQEGCTATNVFTLTAPLPFAITSTKIDNECSGDELGSITINTIVGGQGEGDLANYSFAIRDVDLDITSAAQEENVFSALAAGQYEVFIYDDTALECDYSELFTITEGTEVEVIPTTTDIITCNNEELTVNLSAIGGSGTYTYNVSDSRESIGNPITGATYEAAIGTHYFYAIDDNGCVSDPYEFPVSPITDLMVTLVVDNGFVSCFEDANGILSADVSGGLGDYMYTLLDEIGDPIGDEQPSNRFEGLDIGMYSIRVRSVDCIVDTGVHEIMQNPPLEIGFEFTNPTCSDSTNGTITMSAEGGTGIYEYNISSEDPDKFETNNMFEDLAGGTYTIIVKDSLGCFETVEVTIAAPEMIEISLIDDVLQQVCVGDAAPSAQIAISGGTGDYIIYLNGQVYSDVTNTGNFTDEGAAIYQFTNLRIPEGSDNLRLFVAVGNAGSDDIEEQCIQSLADPLVITPPVDLDLVVNVDNRCDGTTVISAEVDELYEDLVIYTLELASIPGDPIDTPNDTGEFTVTETNIYTIIVEHVDPLIGCIDSQEVSVTVFEELLFEVDDSNQNLLIVTGQGGDEDYEFSVDGSDYSSDNEFIIAETRDYIISIRDSRGCIYTQAVPAVFVPIEIPNLFTPNGDGTNDFWYPINVQDFHDIVVTIYDRYGRRIQIFNGENEGWNGMYEGRPLPSGDYWYTLDYKELTGEEKRLMGHFTLYR